MSLRRNATQFAERVRAAPISGNIDNPEGGLDALMQVKQIIRGEIRKSMKILSGDCLWRFDWLEGRCQEGDYIHH